MATTEETEAGGIDRVDALALAVAVVLGVLLLVWSVLIQRILLGILAGPVLVAIAVGIVLVRRADQVGIEFDRVDAAAAGVAGVLCLLLLGYGVLSLQLLLAGLLVVVVGLATALGLVVRRLV